MSKEVKEDSVGDVKVGELGFGSVAEGGLLIALPNASVSQEIKLEGGGGISYFHRRQCWRKQIPFERRK